MNLFQDCCLFRAVINVNQDRLGIQGKRIENSNVTEVMAQLHSPYMSMNIFIESTDMGTTDNTSDKWILFLCGCLDK